MTGVQVFLMAFGAVLTLIGVLVFFLLAWFKETTGQHDVVKVLQAEFRLTNPALVIFIGGLGLMVAPFFLGQPTLVVPPTPTPQSAPLVQSVATPTPAVVFVPTPPSLLPSSVNTGLEPTPAPPSPTPLPTPTFIPTLPPPTPTLAPTPTATPTPVFAAPDSAGRWRNQNGFLDFRRLGVNEFAYSDFDNFGNLVGQGTATQDADELYLNGEGLIFTGFGYTYYTYTGDFTVSDNVMEGDLYDSFGNYVGSVSFTRDRRSF